MADMSKATKVQVSYICPTDNKERTVKVPITDIDADVEFDKYGCGYFIYCTVKCNCKKKKHEIALTK